MRRFRGRPLSARILFTRALLLLAFTLLCALMAWLVYTQPVEDTQATGSEKTIATSPAIGTTPGQRPNP
jgi:HAMP domain-containing protein